MTTKDIYYFNIVTDPDDPSVHSYMMELFTIIDKDEIIETNMNNSLVRYEIYTRSNIAELAGKISYQPISLSLDRSLLDSIDSNIAGNYLSGISEIIKSISEKLLSIDIIEVEMVDMESVILFNLITKDLITGLLYPIYQNPKYLISYHKILDMEKLFGYQGLSDDPLVSCILKQEYPDIDITEIGGVWLLPVGTNNNEIEHYSDIVNHVNTLITTKRQNGCFSYYVSPHSRSDITLIEEISKNWATEVLHVIGDYIIMKGGDIDFSMEPATWYRNALEMVRNRLPPKITLHGYWQRDIGGDYNEKYDKKWYRSILQYNCYIGYRNLALEYPDVRQFTHLAVVNPDYSISIQLPSYELVLMFLDQFEIIMENNKGYINVEPIKDLSDGISKRIHIQSLDHNALPLIISDNKKEYLIYSSPATAPYNPNSPFDRSRVNMSEITKHEITKHEITKHEITSDNVWGLRGLYDVGDLKGLYHLK